MTGKNLTIGLVTAAVVGIGIIGIVAATSKDKSNEEVTSTANNNSNNSNSVNSPTQSTNIKTYKDGSYSAEGSYISPGGQEFVAISLVLKDNKVESVEFTGKADNSTSKQYQGFFANGYESKVVGKKIDEIQLDKVSGSSLTSKGFMEALNKIKNEAS